MSRTVLFERRLPLAWSIHSKDQAEVPPDHNHLIFALLDSSDDTGVRHQDKDLSADLQRMEAKLNVIMQLLGMLMSGAQTRPPERDIRFSSDTLSWQTESSLEPGQQLAVTLFPEAGIPIALRFAVRVRAYTDGWLVTDLVGLSEEERAIWSRWVFRQHRRQVALIRAHTTPEAL